MPRAAGNSRTYKIGVCDNDGNLVEELDGFVSVTTVIKAVDASSSGGLMGWAYNLGIAGALELVSDGRIKKDDDLDTLKKAMTRHHLTPWSKRDSAGGRGSGIHDSAEKLLRGQTTPDEVMKGTPSADKGYAAALCSWFEKYTRHPVALERVLVHLGKEYAGTADLIDADEDGSPVHRVMDFKTSKRIYDSQFIQSAAYAQAWEDMTRRQGSPCTVEGVGVIRFGEDGFYEEQVRPYESATVFNAMLDLYRQLQVKG